MKKYLKLNHFMSRKINGIMITNLITIMKGSHIENTSMLIG